MLLLLLPQESPAHGLEQQHRIHPALGRVSGLIEKLSTRFVLYVGSIPAWVTASATHRWRCAAVTRGQCRLFASNRVSIKSFNADPTIHVHRKPRQGWDRPGGAGHSLKNKMDIFFLCQGRD